MSWVRISDDFMDHPKFVGLGADAPVAVTLWLAGLGYCNRYLTDGHIPAGILGRLTTMDPAQVAIATEALVGADLWEREDAGYRVHDFLDYQRPREAILEARRTNAERVRKWRAANVGPTLANADESRNGVTNGVANAVRNATPNPNPNPNPNTHSQAESGNAVTSRKANLYDAFQDLMGVPATPNDRSRIDNLCRDFDRELVGKAMYADPNPSRNPEKFLGRVYHRLREPAP